MKPVEHVVEKDENYQQTHGTKAITVEKLPFSMGEDGPDRMLQCVHCDEFNALVNITSFDDGSKERLGILAMRLNDKGIFMAARPDELRNLAAAFNAMADAIERGVH